jgi:hypothetical protein
VRIYPISYAEDHQIRSAPLPHYGVLANIIIFLMSIRPDVNAYDLRERLQAR